MTREDPRWSIVLVSSGLVCENYFTSGVPQDSLAKSQSWLAAITPLPSWEWTCIVGSVVRLAEYLCTHVALITVFRRQHHPLRWVLRRPWCRRVTSHPGGDPGHGGPYVDRPASSSLLSSSVCTQTYLLPHVLVCLYACMLVWLECRVMWPLHVWPCYVWLSGAFK